MPCQQLLWLQGGNEVNIGCMPRFFFSRYGMLKIVAFYDLACRAEPHGLNLKKTLR